MNKSGRHLVKCLRCGYEWFTSSDRPKVCVAIHCHSPYWDEPRKDCSVEPQPTERPLSSPTEVSTPTDPIPTPTEDISPTDTPTEPIADTPTDTPTEASTPTTTPTEPILLPSPIIRLQEPIRHKPIIEDYLDSLYKRPPPIINPNADCYIGKDIGHRYRS